jgi:nitric oxide reductase NorD protein
MSEAEDVIVDAARHATAYAMDLWRRNRASESAPAGVALVDVRRRLEILVEAALGSNVQIRTAAAPAPRTVLSRLFQRGGRGRPQIALPATDGAAVFLPARIADDAALDFYRVCALHQALRIERGSARLFPWAASPLVQDLYLLSETAAVGDELRQRFPGFARALARVSEALLGARPRLDGLAEPLRSLEALYQDFLASGHVDGRRLAESAAASLAWARAHSAALAPASRHARIAADALLGEVVEADASCRAYGGDAPDASAAPQPSRSAKLSRRPRARGADENEDDENTGMWMIQASQPNEHAEDAMGLQRPVDKQPDADLHGAGESLSELEALKLVSTPGLPREVFVDEDARAVNAARPEAQRGGVSNALAYPEWDYTIGAYRERAVLVRTLPCVEGAAKWVDDALARHRATLVRVRRQFEALRSRRSRQHAQPEGDELDLATFVNGYADRRAKLPRSDRLYLAQRAARRDFALLLLIDVSASTESWCGGGQRIIDLEKDALVVVAAALDALRVPFEVQAFSGYGPRDVRVRNVKTFGERFDRGVARRVAALEPDEFTRAGAAMRHATATLLRERAHRRLMLLLSDGKPNDCDRYEGRYGYEDARQALAEARMQGVAPFCVTVDRHASRHLAGLFGPGNYTIATEPGQLTAALLEWLRTVTVALS